MHLLFTVCEGISLGVYMETKLSTLNIWNLLMNTLIVHGMQGDKSRCIYGNKVIYPQHLESSYEYTYCSRYARG